MRNIFILFILFLFCNLLVAQPDAYENLNRKLSPDAMQEDIDYWLTWLHATHPNLAYTVENVDNFYFQVNQTTADIKDSMSVREFWKNIAVLNSVLSDGHTIVAHISGGILRDYLAHGGRIFPFEVVLSDGKLYIDASHDRDGYHGARILNINGIETDSLLSSIRPIVNGDNPTHREAILERKFALLFLLMFGESNAYELQLSKGEKTWNSVISGISKLPKFYSSPNFDDLFKFEILDHDNALLIVNEFWWNDKQQYMEFMKNAFTELQTNEINHLIIDIRNNGGGDDEYWIDGILKYLADKPFRWGSNYTKKIIKKYRDPGEVIGTVVKGEIDTLLIPEKENPLRFKKNISVLIGPYTYSSAILFANTVQDYDFARLIGEATGGKSGQTGGIQFSTMPNSGLMMVSPRFYLERPKGGNANKPVQPDIVIKSDKLNDKDLINKTIKL